MAQISDFATFEAGWAKGQNQLVHARLTADLDTAVSVMMKLTDAGREIYPALETAFREIASIAPLGEVGPRDKRLILSVLPWLAPWALGALADYPAAVELRVEPDPVALTEGAADLRLSYGGALYPDHKVVPLFADQMVIVQARPGPLADAPRITVHWGAAYASLPGWALWHAQSGLLPLKTALSIKVIYSGNI